jgi:undecaprenyl-diphosphatase
MRPSDGSLPLRHAVALGLAQGPTELLPVSSSGHTTLLPWLAGWPYVGLDGDVRKSFEVALHAGAGLALAIDMRRELLARARRASPRQGAALALSLAPAAVVGVTMRRPIESRLGGPRSIAAGLVGGAIAMALADARPATGGRKLEQVGLMDGFVVGLAQAAALIPGVSRNGATLTAARARGFDRRAAQELSWTAAFPVILGASALKGRRLAGHGLGRQERAAIAAGGVSSFLSTLISARLMRRPRCQEQPLVAFSAYRVLLALLVLSRLRRNRAAG